MKNLFLKNPARAMMGIALLLVVLVAPFMPVAVFAQPQAPDATSDITTVDGIIVLIERIFNILFVLLILLAGIFIIWAAFMYLTAGGDPEKVKKANHSVIYAAVAVVIAVLAKAIPRVICNFLGANCDFQVFDP